MRKIIKEMVLFGVFAYLAVWLSFLILSFVNLRAANPNLSEIENVYLVQLSFFLWLISLLIIYLLRLIFYFVNSKLNPNSDSESP